MTHRSETMVALFAIGALSCSAEPTDPQAGRERTSQISQPERWSAADDPARFGGTLERRLGSLPTSGAVSRSPWPGSYWPTYADSINQRWNGSEPSPAEKYGSAFGVSDAAERVSRYYGIDSRSSASSCRTSSDCNASNGETCAIRRGFSEGRCIPSWFGICHAWAPAAILFPEPRHAVTWNGVTFRVNDVKALLSLVHDRLLLRFVSLRCYQSDRRGEIGYDAYGRPEASSCRDSNPGTLHLLLTNYLARDKSFVIDEKFDDEVWSYPLSRFTVDEIRTVSSRTANLLLGAGGDGASRDGWVDRGEWQDLGSFPVEPGAFYRVTMSGDGDADLYVRLGAPPSLSTYDCRPYTGASNETCAGDVSGSARSLYVAVHGYAPSSFNVTVTGAGGAPEAYTFNSDARGWAYVRTSVRHVVLTPSSQDGPLSGDIDRYTQVSRYEYVLELDEQNRIIGGEWVGNSKRSHPDFVWLPVGPGQTSFAGGAITYENVKTLADLSVQ